MTLECLRALVTLSAPENIVAPDILEGFVLSMKLVPPDIPEGLAGHGILEGHTTLECM